MEDDEQQHMTDVEFEAGFLPKPILSYSPDKPDLHIKLEIWPSGLVVQYLSLPGMESTRTMKSTVREDAPRPKRSKGIFSSEQYRMF